MNKEILERYATLKIEAQKIDNEIKFLQPEVLKEILAISDTQPVELSEVGTFTIRKLKKWEYSPELNTLKEQIAGMELKEKQNGKAQFTESQSLMFKIYETT